jgi:hypothetical protein
MVAERVCGRRNVISAALAPNTRAKRRVSALGLAEK